ncbi:hypothetical protein [Wolbachia endosymbiont of Nomada ferruginata]|nr:hypothetical protein [Wolbachia endosymbiont of Nomada ferruginata]
MTVCGGMTIRFIPCHPSAQTLGSSLFIIIKTLYFNIKRLLLYLPT